MFTGLVQDIGTLRSRRPQGDDVGLVLETQLAEGGLELGESIAVNGVCLTVTSFDERSFQADASTETLARSSLGKLQPGDGVHLERALRVGDRLGGHFVQGHVDGVGTLTDRRPTGRATRLSFRVDAALSREIVEKGSIAIDGVSLTVNSVQDTLFQVVIVPFTAQKTLLTEYRPGRAVNVETDVLGKYVHRALAGLTDRDDGPGSRLEALLEAHGFKDPKR